MHLPLKAIIGMLVGLVCIQNALAGGGPLGIDTRLNVDNHGIWKRGNQNALLAITIGGEVAGALWEGSDSRLGKTFWQSIDASAIGGAGYLALSKSFRRLRPSQTDSPDQWFKSGGDSFPSGHVTAVTTFVTPFVLEYGHDHPSVYTLELLPLYMMEARMKVQAHWQTDVLASYMLGTAAGYYAHSRSMPVSVGILPRGLTVGWHKKF